MEQIYDNAIYSKKFTVCKGLVSKDIKEITLHPNTISIDEYAFFGSKLEKININDCLYTIGKFAFAESKLQEIDLTPSFNPHIFIGNNAFAGCINLEKVTLGENVTNLGDAAFFNCSALKNIDISNTKIEVIGMNEFNSCTSLNQIILPQTLKKIHSGAFGLTHLEKIDIPNSVTFLDKGIFYCTNIKTLKIPDSLKEIEDIFFGTNIEKIYYDKTSTEILRKVFKLALKYHIDWKRLDLEEIINSKTFKQANKEIKKIKEEGINI